jgi:hypothetical protein
MLTEGLALFNSARTDDEKSKFHEEYRLAEEDAKKK